MTEQEIKDYLDEKILGKHSSTKPIPCIGWNNDTQKVEILDDEIQVLPEVATYLRNLLPQKHECTKR